MSKIAPCLWFNGEAEEAANFDVSLFPDAAIGTISRYGAGALFPRALRWWWNSRSRDNAIRR